MDIHLRELLGYIAPANPRKKENASMPHLSSDEDALCLRAFLQDSGYTVQAVCNSLDAVEFVSAQLRNEARFLDRTSAPSPLNTLLRLFWMGLPQPLKDLNGTIPEEVLRVFLRSGMAVQREDLLIPQTMLVPVEDLFIASDFNSALQRNQPDFVLWPNPTSSFLSSFTVRLPSRATLDLGVGCGVLSLLAARHSENVVATDLNPRALEFAAFNARLNGIAGIETALGDCFEPVQGRTFDLIVSNPPFFITPKSELIYCENPLELDSLCRRIAKEAPAHLNQGGYFEMLCEWAEIEGQPWEERVAEWVAASGCDAWILKRNTQGADEYAQNRIRETSLDVARDGELYADFMAYYRQRKVKAIHGGLIVLRRRQAANWVLIEEPPTVLVGDISQMVLDRFSAFDLFQLCAEDETLLSVRLALGKNVRLDRRCALVDGRWKVESMILRTISGFPADICLQPEVAEFVALLDGSRTVGEATQALSAAFKAPLEIVQRESITAVRNLVQRGFLVSCP